MPRARLAEPILPSVHFLLSLQLGEVLARPQAEPHGACGRVGGDDLVLDLIAPEEFVARDALLALEY